MPVHRAVLGLESIAARLVTRVNRVPKTQHQMVQGSLVRAITVQIVPLVRTTMAPTVAPVWNAGPT